MVNVITQEREASGCLVIEKKNPQYFIGNNTICTISKVRTSLKHRLFLQAVWVGTDHVYFPSESHQKLTTITLPLSLKTMDALVSIIITHWYSDEQQVIYRCGMHACGAGAPVSRLHEFITCSHMFIRPPQSSAPKRLCTTYAFYMYVHVH